MVHNHLYHVTIPFGRIDSQLVPALLVHSVVDTIVVYYDEDDWQIVSGVTEKLWNLQQQKKLDHS